MRETTKTEAALLAPRGTNGDAHRDEKECTDGRDVQPRRRLVHHLDGLRGTANRAVRLVGRERYRRSQRREKPVGRPENAQRTEEGATECDGPHRRKHSGEREEPDPAGQQSQDREQLFGTHRGTRTDLAGTAGPAVS